MSSTTITETATDTAGADPRSTSRPATPTPHRPGGIPAIPALVASGNAAVALASATALAAGPVAGAAAVGGATVFAGTAVARRIVKRRRNSRQAKQTAKPSVPAPRRASRAGYGKVGRLALLGMTGTAGRATSGGRVGKTPSKSLPGAAGSRTAGSRAGGGKALSNLGRGGNTAAGCSGGASKLGALLGKARTAGGDKAPASASALRHGPAHARAGAGGKGSVRTGSGRNAARGARGLLGRGGGKDHAAATDKGRAGLRGSAAAVKALRSAAGAGAGTLAQRRKAATQARRAQRDTRAAASIGRAKGTALRARLAGQKGRARAWSALAWGRGRRHGALKRLRALVDRRRDKRAARVRDLAASQSVRAMLRRSTARYVARRMLSAVVCIPVGVLGWFTTALGRRWGIAGLMHPGRRLHARLADAAWLARQRRDEAIRQAASELSGADDPAAVVPRAPEHHGAASAVPDTTTSMGAYVNGFLSMAEELESAANSYEPEGMMSVLQLCREMPEAMTHIANALRILAERADGTFPMDPRPAEEIVGVYELLARAAAQAEQVAPAFETAHEADIARLTDPRGDERMWNPENNEA